MYFRNALRAATALTLISTATAYAQNITIATVNNGDMIRMQGYTDQFTADTGIAADRIAGSPVIDRIYSAGTCNISCAHGIGTNVKGVSTAGKLQHTARDDIKITRMGASITQCQIAGIDIDQPIVVEYT